MSGKQSGYVKPIIIGVFTTVLAGLILSYFSVDKGSQDSGDSANQPLHNPKEMGALLEKLTIERGVKFGDFLLDLNYTMTKESSFPLRIQRISTFS